MNHLNKQAMTKHRRQAKASEPDQIEAVLAEHFQRGIEIGLNLTLNAAFSICGTQAEFMEFVWHTHDAVKGGSCIHAAIQEAERKMDRARKRRAA